MRVWLARWWWAGAGLAALLGLATVGWVMRQPLADRLRHHPYFVVDQIAVEGVGPALTPEDVTAWIGLTDTTTIWEATPARVRARLEEHPFIKTATVRRIFPGRLQIVVRERRPEAITVLGGLFFVDRDGETFGPLRDADPRNLPIITGLDGDLPAGTRRWMLRRALRLLRRCGRDAATPACGGPLSEVHVDVAEGVTVFPTSPRVPLVLGWGSWPTKLDRAGRALRDWRDSTDRLARLDLRFHNQVVATLRHAAAPPAPAAARPRRSGHGLKA